MKYPFVLADREVGPAPERHDFTTIAAYLATWHYWRVVRRDASFTHDELQAYLDALRWKIEQITVR